MKLLRKLFGAKKRNQKKVNLWLDSIRPLWEIRGPQSYWSGGQWHFSWIVSKYFIYGNLASIFSYVVLCACCGSVNSKGAHTPPPPPRVFVIFVWKSCKFPTVGLEGSWRFIKGITTWRWGAPDRWGNMRRVTQRRSCKLDQMKMKDYMDRRVTPPKWVTSPTWGPPPPCKQALKKPPPPPPPPPDNTKISFSCKWQEITCSAARPCQVRGVMWTWIRAFWLGFGRLC